MSAVSPKEIEEAIKKVKNINMNDELKSCPFCGAKATLEHYENDGYLPHCTECDGMVERWFNSKKDAIIAWNRRI